MPRHNRWAPAFRAMRTACKTRVLTHTFLQVMIAAWVPKCFAYSLAHTHTDRHTPLRTVLVFSEHMYCRAEFMLNSGSLQHGILKLSHTCLLRKNQKRNPCLFFGYILNNRHFSPRQKMTSGCVLAQLLPLERFVYHHKSVCFIATLLTARRYYSCCNQLYRWLSKQRCELSIAVAACWHNCTQVSSITTLQHFSVG